MRIPPWRTWYTFEAVDTIYMLGRYVRYVEGTRSEKHSKLHTAHLELPSILPVFRLNWGERFLLCYFVQSSARANGARVTAATIPHHDVLHFPSPPTPDPLHFSGKFPFQFTGTASTVTTRKSGAASFLLRDRMDTWSFRPRIPGILSEISICIVVWIIPLQLSKTSKEFLICKMINENGIYFKNNNLKLC